MLRTGTQRLPRYIGKSKAMELVLTGKTMSAQEALTRGNVCCPVPSVITEGVVARYVMNCSADPDDHS